MSTMSSYNIENPALPRIGGRLIDDDGAWVEIYAGADLPTRHGHFQVYVFSNSLDHKEHLAVTHGQVAGCEAVKTRLHSECLTGDVLGSLRCDCRAQLEMSLDTMGHAEPGLLLYMRQEGRGIGLGNKIRAYALQETGLDTIEANEHLGFDDDLRDYRVAALMLHALQVRSVLLATNNPRKIFGLRSHGVVVAGRQPLVTQTNPHNVGYLRTKAQKSGHMLPLA